MPSELSPRPEGGHLITTFDVGYGEGKYLPDPVVIVRMTWLDVSAPGTFIAYPDDARRLAAQLIAAANAAETDR